LPSFHWRAGEFARAEADLAPLLTPGRIPVEDPVSWPARARAHEARRGRFARAFLRFDEIAELNRRAGEPDAAALPAAEKAFWLAFVREDLGQARAVLEAGLREPETVGAGAVRLRSPRSRSGTRRRRVLGRRDAGLRSRAEAGAFLRGLGRKVAER